MQTTNLILKYDKGLGTNKQLHNEKNANVHNSQCQKNSNISVNNKISEDIVEISSNPAKKPLNKKLIGCIALATLSVAGIFAALKIRNHQKMKKQIIELYDSLFEYMSKNISNAGINLEKPELVFRNTKEAIANYDFSSNKIALNLKKIKHIFLRNDLTSKALFDGKSFQLDSPFLVTRSLFKKGIRKATNDEKMLLAGKSLYHELTHARQTQSALSIEGGLDFFIKGLQEKYPKLTLSDIKKSYPFLFSYKPSKLLPKGTKFSETIPVSNKYSLLRYSLKDIVVAMTSGYDKSSDAAYFMNLAEISARNGELKYYDQIKQGILSKPESVSKKIIQQLLNIHKKNLEVLLDSKMFLLQKDV